MLPSAVVKCACPTSTFAASVCSVIGEPTLGCASDRGRVSADCAGVHLCWVCCMSFAVGSRVEKWLMSSATAELAGGTVGVADD